MDSGSTSGGTDELPTEVLEEAERLSRLAREAVDGSEAEAYRADRAALLEGHGYAARIREDDGGDVLVCYPAEWLEDGTVRVDRVEDVSRGVEVSLSGHGEGDDWAAVEAANREVAESVAERHGTPHGATAHALADFAGNHYAKRIEALTREERREFRTEYLPRNAWPSEDQRAALEESVRLTMAEAGAPLSTEKSE